MTKPVEIVTITKIIPIYKDGIEANSINVVNFTYENGNECGYNIITQKNLYKVGDKGVYIQPDYCLSDTKIFESFIRPNGDVKKSKLGKNFRIRAIKFNFSFEGNNTPIYSFGILLPKTEVDEYIKKDSNTDDITEILGITKYEEPESSGSGLIKGDFPSFMYKTDEENSANLKSHINKVCDGNTEVGLVVKTDGSSFTQYFKKYQNGEFITGICSRSQEKKLEQSYVSEYVDENGNKYHKYIHPETKIKGWYCDVLSEFKTNDEISSFTSINIEVKDSWVDLSKSSGLFDKGMEYCKKYNTELVFRGEIYGSGLKGSGNKLNPDSNKKQGLTIFGIDSLESGYSIRQNYSDVHNLKKVCDELSLSYNEPFVVKPKGYDDLISICEDLFNNYKNSGVIIEGFVVRTMYTNDLSCKVMNPEYDSKK